LDLVTAGIMFFSGALTHIMATRIFNTWSKGKAYKIAYINSIAILKFMESMSQSVIRASGLEEEKNIQEALRQWRDLSLYSLRVCITDDVWQKMAAHDWDTAMRMLKKIEDMNYETRE